MMTTYDLARQQGSAPSAETLNAFMRQRDVVTGLINKEEVFMAKTMLDLLHPLWQSLGLGYKGRELYRTIRENCREITL